MVENQQNYWLNKAKLSKSALRNPDLNNWPKIGTNKNKVKIENNTETEQLERIVLSENLTDKFFCSTASSSAAAAAAVTAATVTDTVIITNQENVDEITSNVHQLNINSDTNTNYDCNNSTSYDKTKDARTREQILAERRLRKTTEKNNKYIIKLEKELVKIRTPKTDKVKLIDNNTFQKYLENQKSDAGTSSTIQQFDVLNCTHKRGSIKIASKKKFKKNKSIQIQLTDLLNKKSSILLKNDIVPLTDKQRFVASVKRLKGKRREIPRKKRIGYLKRRILTARKNRKNNCFAEAVCEEISVDKQKVEEKTPTIQDEVESLTLVAGDDNKINDVKTSPSVKNVQFTRKFRSYCNNFITPELCSLTVLLLKDVFRFQDRAYNKNEIKARAQKRFVVGFKETERQLDINKIKLLILAPDLEPCSESGGIDDIIMRFKDKCERFSIPYVFSIGRRKIGYILLKKVPISCVGIRNYDGSEETAKQLLLCIQNERDKFLAT